MSSMFEAIQGLGIGFPRPGAAAASVSLLSELQINGLLLDPVFRATQEGLLTDLRIGGQPVLCSDLGVGIRCFDWTAQVEGKRALALPVKRRTQVQASFTLDAAGFVVGGIGVDPIPEEEAREVNDPALAGRLSYIFGLGRTVAAGLADFTITATCRKGCDLGAMILYGTGSALDDITIFDISLNNKPLMSGRGGPTVGPNVDEMSLTFFDFQRTDLDGRTLNARIEQNDILVIKGHNYNAAAINVFGGIFTQPE